MLELEQAQERVLALIQPLEKESVSLFSALGRYLAEGVASPRDLPPFDNSAMDGYAVRAEDLVRASPRLPVALHLIGQAAAGRVFQGKLSSGQCVRVFTGSPLPNGADAVIMQEETGADPSTPEQRLMFASVKPWENVRFQGEDVKPGDILVASGECLTVGQAALLAATGCANVAVRRRPVLGLIATGSELREPGQPLAPGQIYESNRVSLAALAASIGAQPRIYPLVPDDLRATQSALTTALSECHAVVTSGGVSVGEMDFVKAALKGLGGELAFWRVAIKPGKPFVLGTWKDKVLFGLPGNPVSAFVTFLVLVRPALLKFQGANELQLPSRPGILAETLTNSGDRRHFLRVVLAPGGQVHSAGGQASHLLHSVARANGLVEVPPKSTLALGTAVSVLVWS